MQKIAPVAEFSQCHDCGDPFPSRGGKKYCSSKCRYRAKDASRDYRKVPCSICGRLRHVGHSSLPEGQLTCHDCRREAGPPVHSLEELQRLHAAEIAEQAVDGGNLTKSQMGLGNRHRQAINTLRALHLDGSPCDWCGRPMWLDATQNYDYDPDSKRRGNGSLQGDHTTPRSEWLKRGLPVATLPSRLLHGACNVQRGDGKNDHLAWVNRNG